MEAARWGNADAAGSKLALTRHGWVAVGRTAKGYA